MERAGLNGKRTAGLLGWSESRVSRLLTGQLTVPEIDIAAFLGLCHVTGEERDRVLRLAREHDTPSWLRQRGSNLPEQLTTLVDHESRVAAIDDFQAIVLNGLLQTGDYARALLERSGTVAAEDVQDRVAARLARQSLFSRPQRPSFRFFVHEFVLRLPVGNQEIMSEQLHELLRLGVRDHITIRVIPAEFGAHAGTAGSCTLMSFDDFKPVVYVEEETAGHFLEEPEDIASYRDIFADLAECALDEKRSRDLITALAVELYGGPT